MKFRKTIVIVVTIFIPVLLLTLMSQSLVQAADRLAGAGSSMSEAGALERSADSALAPQVDEADLGIEKGGQPAAVAAGNRLTYTLTISNGGAVSATNVIVTDTLPLSVTVDSVSTSLGDICTEQPPIVCALSDLLADDTVTITIATTVDSGASGVLHNEAEVDSVALESNTANNQAALDTAVFAEADLWLSKTDTPDPVGAGQIITYTLTVTNLGPSNVTGVVLTDTLPASVTLVSASPSQGPPCAEGSQVVCQLGELEASVQATVLFEVAVDETFSGLLANDAEVSGAAADPNELNNSAGAETTVDPIADLAVSKSSTPDTAVAGEPLAYQLIITNGGFFSATNVVLTDTLPASTSAITFTASQGDCSLGSTVTCSLGLLQPGAWATIDLSVLVDPSAVDELLNLVEASSDTKEIDYQNNSFELTTLVTTLADLSVGKTAAPDPAVAGGLLTYSIVVNNAGPSDATGVEISDTLPASTTFVSASILQGATVVRTTDTSLWEPSSPDPAGITFIPADDTLMVSDSEVEEFPYRRDENLFTATRPGEMITVATTTGFSDEPTGLAYDPATETLFVSDDVLDRVFMVLAGPDGQYGTPDDIVSFFQTNVFSNTVPEGVAFDTNRGHLYTIDGSLNDVFDIDPGDDGLFGTADDVITSFDVQKYGIIDAEGIAFNPESDTIWVGDHANPRVVETTVGGAHLRTFELTPESLRVAGLTVAPSTANPSVLSLYIADRAVDNNQDPTENDGKIYEVAIPTSSGSGGFCAGDPVVQCNLGGIAAGDTALVSIVVQVDLLAPGPLTNTVAVQSTTPDDNGENDTSIIATTVVTRADLTLTKSDEPDPVAAGEQLTYTLVVSNNGPSIAEGVLLEDLLPANTTVYTTTASQGPGCLGEPNVLCDLGQITAGGRATVTLVVDVSPSALFSLTNQATVSSLTNDGRLQDNTVTEVTTVTTQADLAVVKAAWPLAVTAGNRLTYTMVVSNFGPSLARDVILTDTLPAGVLLASSSASQGPGCSGESILICPLGQLAPSTTASVTLVVTVTPGVTGTLPNLAEVASAAADPNQANNISQTLTPVETVADISVSKTAAVEPVYAGTLLTYTVTLANAGPSDALAVVLTDTLPSGLSFVEAAANHELNCSDGDLLVCQLGTLAANSTAVVTLTTSISPGLAAQQITNTVTVTSTTGDPIQANNSDSVQSTLLAEADLVVSKSASADTVLAGTVLSYFVTIQNAGPSLAASVMVTDTLPAAVSLLSIDESQGNCSGATPLACSLGDFAPGDTAQITISVQVDPLASGILTNTVVGQSTMPDSNGDNNTSTITATVISRADLTLIKSDDPDPVAAGERLTYTLVVNNHGPSTAQDVLLGDQLPADTAVYATDASQGAGCLGEPNVLCELGQIGPGGQATVTLVVDVSPSALYSLTNQATLSSLTEDDFPEDNSVTEVTTVTTQADLAVVKAAWPLTVTAGNRLTYTLAVTNFGPSLARDLVLTDTLPGGVVLASSSASQGPGCSVESVLLCSLGQLEPGASASVTLVVTVTSGVTETLPNLAEVASATADPNQANNDSQTLTPVETVADISVTKTASAEPVYAGTLLTYTVTLANAGPSDALAVVLTDTLPGGVSLISATADHELDCNDGDLLVCQLGTMVADSTAVVTLTTSISPALAVQQITNTVIVTSATSDPNEANNSDSVQSTLQTPADLAVTKVASADPVLAGTVLTYFVTVQNLGPALATGVMVTDTLPPEVSLVSVDESLGSCSGTTVIGCSLGQLAPMASAQITIVVTVDPGAMGSIENVVLVKGQQDDPEVENNQELLITGVDLEGSLPLIVEDNPDPVVAGTNLTYTLSVSSIGPSDASNVVLTDTLPEGVQFVTVTTDTGSCDHNSGAVTCQLGDMTVSSNASVEILVLVDTDTLGQISNEAIVTADQADPTVAHENTTVIASADLSVKNAATPEEVMPGGMITYTIDITNAGPSLARNVIVNNSLPAGVSFNSSPDCAPSNGSITCSLGDLDLNETVQTYFVVDVATGATGAASSTASGLSDTPDPKPANNTSTAVSNIVPASDLAVSQTAVPAQPEAGGIITYTLTVTNYGPSSATGVQVFDTLPDGVVKLSAITSKGANCLGTSVLLCSLGVMASGEVVTITVVVQIDDPFSGDLTNTADVLSTVDDPDESNNTSILTINIPLTEYLLYLPVVVKP